jgi:tetratricopeptide (TPR) repeat protein
MSTRLLGKESLKVARALDLLACICLTQSKAVQAEPLYRQALATYQKLPATEDETVARLMGRLSEALAYQGDSRLAEAEDWIQRALALQRKLFGDNHPDIAYSLFTLASVQHLQGKLAEADDTYRETEKIWRTLQGDERVEMADTLNNLANLLRKEGNLPEAEAKQREALLVQRKVFGDKHKDVAISLLRLGIIQDHRGQPAEAEKSFRQALDIWRYAARPGCYARAARPPQVGRGGDQFNRSGGPAPPAPWQRAPGPG